MAQEADQEETQTSKPEDTKEEPKALSQEDINKLIEGARKQEKDKLYETINGLKEQVQNLSQAQKDDKAAKEAAEAAAKEKADQERQKGLSAEDRMAEQLKRFEERLAQEAAQREKLQDQLAEERENTELERYKSELLAQAGDEIVRELVQGKTRQELDASVQTAKNKYQHYFSSAVKNAEGDPGRKIQDAGSKMPKPADPDPDPVDEEGLRGLMPQIDPYASGAGKVSEDYKKNREDLLNRVANAYGKQATR